MLISFHKLEFIFGEVNRVFHKLSLSSGIKIEVSIDTTGMWNAYGSFWLLP